MSGVELVGLAASILQIADLGWKLSYKLYAFSRKVHEAGKNIELISQDISATGAVLKQFADELDKDEKASTGGRLASLELIKAARGIVEECETLFKEIDASIDGRGGNKVILDLKAKLKWSYLEPRIQLLRLNLGRLKASLALMLNVLVYAEQIRGRETMDVLREQKNLIESFAAEKSDTAKKVEQLSKRIEQAPDSVANTKPVQPVEKPMQQSSDDFTSFGTSNIQQHKNTGTSTARDISADSTQDFFKVKAVNTTAAEGSIMLQASESKTSSTDFSTLVEEPALPSAEIADLEHQRNLIEKLLEEVNSSSYAIDHGARYKFHDGVLGLHWQVWAPLRTRHGDDSLRKILSQSPVLARHLHERLLNESRVPISREFSKLSIRKGSLGGFDVPGEIRSHTSPSNKTAEQALRVELLKAQKNAESNLAEMRAQQDALQAERRNSMRQFEQEIRASVDQGALREGANLIRKIEEQRKAIMDQEALQGKMLTLEERRRKERARMSAEQASPRDEGNLWRKFKMRAMGRREEEPSNGRLAQGLSHTASGPPEWLNEKSMDSVRLSGPMARKPVAELEGDGVLIQEHNSDMKPRRSSDLQYCVASEILWEDEPPAASIADSLVSQWTTVPISAIDAIKG